MRPVEYLPWRRDADAKYDALKFPPDCKELHQAFAVTNSRVWHFLWYLEFTDGKYVRVSERFDRWSGLDNASRKMSFAYHYGPIVNRGPDGLPAHQAADPVDIRIDNSCRPAHLHHQAPEPHIPQANIKGLVLDEMDGFAFVNGIFRHRCENKSLQAIFGFKVV